MHLLHEPSHFVLCLTFAPWRQNKNHTRDCRRISFFFLFAPNLEDVIFLLNTEICGLRTPDFFFFLNPTVNCQIWFFDMFLKQVDDPVVLALRVLSECLCCGPCRRRCGCSRSKKEQAAQRGAQTAIPKRGRFHHL